MNGSIRVFNAASGALAGTLENEETVGEAMPISRIRCKPGHTESSSSNLLAATYVSGHLRIWNYNNGHCVSQVSSCIVDQRLFLGMRINLTFRFKMKTRTPNTFA